MEQDEIQRRVVEAKSSGDEAYWDGWLSEVEWNQVIQAVAIVGCWDDQLKDYIAQGYLPDHPYAVCYSPEMILEGRAT